MFRAVVSAEILRTALESVGVLVDECRVHLDGEGLAVRAVDPANVGMVDLRLDAAAFESYEADGGVVGVDLSRLSDVVGMAETGGLVDLALDERAWKLHVGIDGLAYTLALVDPDAIRQEPDVPDLDLPARVVVEGRDLNRAVAAADMVSDHVALGVDEDGGFFYVEAEGDTDDVRLELDADDLVDITVAPARSVYSLEYLKDVNRAVPADAEVAVALGEEFPVELRFEIAEGMGTVTYVLAPRIQSA